jgi:TonB family protein
VKSWIPPEEGSEYLILASGVLLARHPTSSFRTRQGESPFDVLDRQCAKACAQTGVGQTRPWCFESLTNGPEPKKTHESLQPWRGNLPRADSAAEEEPMRVLLAGPDYEENLSIRYLSSSLLSAGHDPSLAVFNSPADIPSVASAAERAELVGLSMCFQSRAGEFLHLARSIKSRDPQKIVVAGGHYASCAASPLLANHPEIDVIAIHESERTLVEIADAMPHLQERLPSIAGIAYRDGAQVRFTNARRTLDDLDALPFPDRRGPVPLIAGVPTIYLMGSRGCYGSCAYCCITTLHRIAPGKRFRQRDPERIADEMAALYKERGVRQFVFHDDNFLVPSEALNHARLAAFEKAFKRRGLEDFALVIKCRPADASPGVLRRLKELGLVRVFFGIESSTARGLSTLERTQTVEDSERALEACATVDISAQFTLMIFNPDATLDTLRSDVAFMRRFCGNPLNFCRAEIYAGTPLEKRMIDLGRARGDYLARVYSLADPVADLACNLSLDLFEPRCWSNGSLMQRAIGLDHLAAVTKRFYKRPSEAALCERVGTWLRSVNLDTIDILNEVIDLSSSTNRSVDTGIQRALRALGEREAITRRKLLADGSNLMAELETLHLPNRSSQFNRLPSSRFRLARQAAVAVLAFGMPALAGCQSGVSEMAPPPLKDGQTPNPDSRCSLVGDVTDPQGAVVANATITIKNLDTGVTRAVTTNDAGHYVAGGLKVGHYTVEAYAPGFRTVEKTGIVLEAGSNGRADVALEIRADFKLEVTATPYGVCEFAASPLKVPAVEEDLTTKKKPFTYVVGEAEDHGTFKGIAELVYGDPGMWVQIFEANRDVMEKPEAIPAGTSILIPKRARNVPKLMSRVLPVYPPSAKATKVWGDVVLDVTLKEDGSVDQVDVIDGPAELVEAATIAMKQWRYRPSPAAKTEPVKFVVVVSFTKRGKVH